MSARDRAGTRSLTGGARETAGALAVNGRQTRGIAR